MKANQENRRERADEHYEAIGRSVAALVVDAKVGARKAWTMLGGIDLYRFWMLKHWVDRYNEEHKPVAKRAGRPRRESAERSARREELLGQLKSGRALDNPV